MRKAAWAIAVWVYLLTGCVTTPSVAVPEHFQPFIEELDKEGADRLSAFEADSVYRCYEENDGSLTVVQSVDAYEEPMLILVNLDREMIRRVEILFENETDDYGSYVREDWFLNRFRLPSDTELSLVRRKKESENDVIAITGATITSRSVVMAVNNSINILEEKRDGKN